MSRKWYQRVNQWLGSFLIPWLYHQVITGGNNDTSKSTSWKVLETVLSHLKRELLLPCFDARRSFYMLRLQPVFTSKKISEDSKAKEAKPALVNQICVVYEVQCNSCNSNYIGYTSRHLHMRIEEHKYSVIGKHLKNKHNERPTNLHEQSTALRKCRGKFECLTYEMLLIRKKRPTLNTQNDSIPAKLFI